VSDTINLVAKAMAADLHAEPDEVQQAFRYLFARVALAEGLLELTREELRPSGLRLVCREPACGKLYTAERPAAWTEAEEAKYVAEMRRNLLGEPG
jgi:hypothetical protein